MGKLEKKRLTSEQRSVLLLGELAKRADSLGYGRITCELVVHEGNITQIECVRLVQRLRVPDDL